MSNGKSYRVTCDTAEIKLAMSKGLEVNYIGSDGGYAAVEIPSEKPKIKMTKTLPDSAGLYLRSDSVCISDMKVVYVLDYPDAPLPESIANRVISKYHGVDACEGTDFYWAKVDQSMFELEGE